MVDIRQSLSTYLRYQNRRSLRFRPGKPTVDWSYYEWPRFSDDLENFSWHQWKWGFPSKRKKHRASLMIESHSRTRLQYQISLKRYVRLMS